MIQETFGMLLRNRAHWEFELFLMLLFDGLIAGILIPLGHKHWKHHLARDERERWAGIGLSHVQDQIAAEQNGVDPLPPLWSMAYPSHVAIPECGEAQTRVGWWCTREIGHEGPCAAISFLDWAARNGRNPAPEICTGCHGTFASVSEYIERCTGCGQVRQMSLDGTWFYWGGENPAKNHDETPTPS
jgi:hypothetical protein